jgi:hypothetical protein
VLGRDDDAHAAYRENTFDAVPPRKDIALANRRFVAFETYAHLTIESRRMRRHEQLNPPK